MTHLALQWREDGRVIESLSHQVELPGDEASTRDNALRHAFSALRAALAPSGDYLLLVVRDEDGAVLIGEWISYRPVWHGGLWNDAGYWADDLGRWPDPPTGLPASS